MSVLSLLSRLRQHNIQFELVESQLKISAPAGKLTSALLKELKNKKGEIIEFLQENVLTQYKFAPVEAVEKKEYYSLSSAQKRLYFLQQVDPGSTVYNMPIMIELTGTEDLTRLKKTFKKLIKRHEMLNTSFDMIEDEPVQKIHDDVELAVEYFDLTDTRDTIHNPGGKPESAEMMVQKLIKAFIRPFDLSIAPLLRVGWIKTGMKNNILLVDMYHIISDGTSCDIMVSDFVSYYHGRELPPLKLQYKDYAEWQNSPLQRRVSQQHEAFWLNEFAGEIPSLNLPLDYPRPLVQSFQGSALHFEIPGPETLRLKEMASKKDATLFMMLLAVFNVLMSKLSGQEDVIIGIPTAGRKHADLENIIGMFVSTLALRNWPYGEKTFIGFLTEVNQGALQAFENQGFQFETLVEKVVQNRDAGRNPLFDVMFNLDEVGVNADPTSPEEVFGSAGKYGFENPVSRFDMTWTAREYGGRLFFKIEYCTSLFKPEAILKLTHYLRKITDAVLENPERKISGIEIIDEEEKNRLLYDFNHTRTGYPKDKTIHELFQQQVGKNRDHIAVAGPTHGVMTPSIAATSRNREIHITYSELNRKSRQLAYVLKEKGVKTDTLVPLMVERSVEMIIGMLAILKAGGAYLPIDPHYPMERKRCMLADSSAKVFLAASGTHIKLRAEVEERFPEILDISDLLSSSTLTLASTSTSNQAGPSNLAYVIYTSGSSGQPKGVMVNHRNVVRLVKHTNYIRFRETDRIMQTGALEFDASTFEIWGALLNGIGLYLPAKDIALTPEKLKKTLRAWGITITWMTSPLFNRMVDADIDIFASPRNLLVGGDVLSPVHINRVRERVPGLTIINGYGPTENTTFSTTYRITGEYDGTIPIGKPIANSTAYILTGYGNLQPIAVPGELYVGGDGVAPGYLNNPELTAEKFDHDLWDYLDDQDKRKKVPGKNYLPMHPCSHATMQLSPHHSPQYPITPSPHHPIYQTGDLARWLSDGNIEFLGRIDGQVKIRGFRIEVGEIETQLLNNKEINQAVVAALQEKNGEKALCAYIVPASGQVFENTSGTFKKLRKYLSQTLPDYMIPSYFVPLGKIPLTPNGKVDRKALPKPGIADDLHYTAPADEIEKKLVRIWSETLGIDASLVGVEADFFAMGGHSLKAASLVSKIHKKFNVKVPLLQIFTSPTIRELSQYIKSSVEDKFVPIRTAEEKEYYALSSAQKRVYILQQMEEGDMSYNIQVTLVLQGPIDKEWMEWAFKELIRRHESFRTSHEILEGIPVQRVHREVPFEIDYFESDEEGAHEIVKRYIKPFDLGRAPILGVGLVKTAVLRHILIMQLHHITADGVSLDLLIREFMALSRGEQLPCLVIQYKDFSQWRNSEKERSALKRQETFWLKEFEEELPVLNLPADFPRPLVRKFEGDTAAFDIGPRETKKLKTFALEQEATLYMVLLAIFYVLLSKLGGQEDIVIGTGVEGRRHEDLRHIIGMFVNTLSLRNYPQGGKNFYQFLEEVKERTLTAFENQDYPFEDLVEKVVKNRDTGRNPLFDITFQLDNIKHSEIGGTGGSNLEILPYHYQEKTSKFDMTLRVSEGVDSLFFKWEYSTSLFKKETIEGFARYFNLIASVVLAAPGKKLSGIEMVQGKAREELLFQLNEALEQEVKVFHHRPHKNLQERLHTAVHLFKDHIAIVYGDRYLTYSELAERSGDIAGGITRKGMKRQTFIGIMMDDRVKLIVSLLGILEAGCVFIPLDMELPGNRLEMMIRSLNLKYIITDNSDFSPVWGTESIGEHRPGFIPVEELARSGKSRVRELSQYTAARCGGEDYIYIYFTSGTTGTPRAMPGKNRGLLHFIDWEIETLGIGPHHRVSQLTNPTFDAFLRDIFVPLCAGGVTCIPESKEIPVDSHNLIRWLEKSRIRLIHCVPSLFRLLSSGTYLADHHFKELNHVLLSGEPIHPADLVRWYEIFGERIQLVNLWGTSETTLAKTCHFIRESDIQREQIPVGQPLPGARVVVLDRALQPCPEGITGEIYILTPFRTSGYCNAPELTNDRFLPNPFNDNPHLAMHKTGDLGRLLPGGHLEVLGRNDRQVKIRGIRVELEEIESLLVRHALVNEAVVVKQEISAGNELLCAYVVLKDSGAGEVREESLLMELEEYLTGKLPAYMVPASITVMEKLPRTSRGKVEYDALPGPLAQNRASYVPPRDELEKSLCSLWSEILRIDIETIGITHRFFELGGNSLNAMALISKIHKEFNIKITMFEIFNNPTIKKQAEIIKKSEREQYLIIENAELKEYYELSPAQKRIYFMQQWNSKIVSYNMSEVVQLEGRLDKKKLEKTFIELIRRHESFRTSFDLIEERPVQRIHRVDEVEFTIEYFEIFSSNHPAPYSPGGIINDIVSPFDLSCAPLLRVGLIKTAGDEYLLVVDMHHTISDGISREIFIREAMSLYRGDELPGLRLQYKDFSQWQTRQKECGILKRQEEYWLKVFGGDMPVLDLPTDFKRPSLQSFTGSRLQFEIDSNEVKILKKMAVAENVTMFMVLLAIFNILLSKLSGQQDIIVGTVITGRTHEDLNNITGMFVNTLALRNFAAKDMTFKEFLVSVRERTLNVFDNQDYPFENLVDKLELYRTADRNPLFSITFDEIEWEGNRPGDNPGQHKIGSTPPLLKLKPYGYDKEISKFDLMLRRIVLEDRLLFNMVYCTKLFKRETIETFIKYFKEITTYVVENNEIKLSEIAISTDLLTVKSNNLEDYQGDFVF